MQIWSIPSCQRCTCVALPGVCEVTITMRPVFFVILLFFQPNNLHSIQVHLGDAGPDLEKAIVREQNLARHSPRLYADFLEATLAYFDGNIVTIPGMPPERTREGRSAVVEAIAFLREVRPVGLLEVSGGLKLGAMDHVADHGWRGMVGHVGTDSSQVWDRVSRYGMWIRGIGENIAYGPYSSGINARVVVSQLIVDDGVADRGHRIALFDPGYTKTGVSCGAHSVYGAMCVVTYAIDYNKNQGPKGH
jgi:uncharacterized protein YkwD